MTWRGVAGGKVWSIFNFAESFLKKEIDFPSSSISWTLKGVCLSSFLGPSKRRVFWGTLSKRASQVWDLRYRVF